MAATAASAPGAAAALELVAADEVVELAAAELVADEDELLLLLPHPTIAPAHSSDTAAETHLLRLRIALPVLVVITQKPRPRIGNIGFTRRIP
jgi:hypothetical protein